MTSDSRETVRVRFAPSPTGYLHIGGARTALFNWLVARRAGGAFVLRIEDTDRTRHVEDSVQKILEDLRWLGLDWDEGPHAGGDLGPYFQSRRLDIYNRYVQQLLESSHAYYALETPEELQAMREAARAVKSGFKYRRPDPLPTVEQGLAARAQGRPVVVRFKTPCSDITIVDEILGTVTLTADQLDDFVIQKSDGFPTYHLACVVDDEQMQITHVLRGQEHLMNTPKHVALQRALGFSTPRYAHMPVIFNMDGSKMSKRDKERAVAKGEPTPQIDVHDFRVAGYLPEAVISFIALMGWNPGDDREQLTRDELISLFDIDRIGKTNAKFDREKLLSFNTDWAARLSEERLLEAFKDYLGVQSANDNSHVTAPDRLSASRDDALLAGILKVCTGFRTFRQVEDKVRFLFTPDEAIEYHPKAVKKVLAKNDGAGYTMLEFLLPKLEAVTDWSADALQQLFQSVCEQRDTKLGLVAQPVRVAITGSTISPSIHDSLSMLGKDHTIARMKRCVALRM